MSIQPITPDRHASLRWRRYENFHFAAKTSLVPLSASEIGPAALAFPLAVVQRGASWTVAAVLGLLPEENLFVDASGTWGASYIPAAFRAYPFLIGSQANGEPILCVNEGSHVVSNQTDGERFFDETGQLSSLVAQVSTFLAETTRSEEVLVRACEALAAAGVIEPWPIEIQSHEGLHSVTGLHRFSEVALQTIAPETFEPLRKSGTLSLFYAQLLSMGHLLHLGKLLQNRAVVVREGKPPAAIETLIELPLDSNESWDWSKVR